MTMRDGGDKKKLPHIPTRAYAIILASLGDVRRDPPRSRNDTNVLAGECAEHMLLPSGNGVNRDEDKAAGFLHGRRLCYVRCFL
jgi:hypothetical protein